jgi:hypothetical protein
MTPGFRHEFRNLHPADALKVLGWLLDPGMGDPHPDLTDAMIDALQPLYEAYCQQYLALVDAAEEA